MLRFPDDETIGGTMQQKPVLGVIGGSGLYSLEGLENIEEHDLDTPFGKPSSPIISGELDEKRVIFLARHGIGHFISPSEINYRANIYAMKMMQVERLISVSACGSLREDFAPGEIVVPDQIFDFTRDRKRTFFEDGLVAHLDVADPFCHQLSTLLEESISDANGVVHRGGSFITIEGPRFSTRAESNTYRAWGMSIIGMTASPEIFLAREAEICYAVMGHVTDYDVWRISEEPVTVETVIQTLGANAQLAQEALKNIIARLPIDPQCSCQNALNNALVTSPDLIPPSTRERLSLLVDRYLP
jgi:5'-methylthioadenosine phosphorylase